MTYWKYGNYQHPEHEVSIPRMEIVPVFSPRNDRFASLYKIHITVTLQHTAAENAAIFAETSTAARKALRQQYLHSKIENLINVYSENYQSCGFYHDDGTPTKHYLSNAASNNISGVRVLYRSWDRDTGDEYATARTAQITVGALFDEADSGIYSYREQVEIHGNCGPDWEWVENQTGVPEFWTNLPYTRQSIYQYGSIIGTNQWALGNVPPPLYPSWEKGRKRVQVYEYPKWHGNQYRLYEYNWSYYMEAPTGQVAVPNIY